MPDDTMLGQNLVDVRNEGRRYQTEQLFTPPVKLTERQQLVYDLTEHGPLNAMQAGVALHTAHGRRCGCGPDRACDWADANGREVLEALKRKGLVRRDVHHVYRRAGETTSAQGDLPEGFDARPRAVRLPT